MSPIEFDESSYYTGPDLTDQMVIDAEKSLGYRLPSSYLELLLTRNGGVPYKRIFPTAFATSWAQTHFEIAAIRGIGGVWGVDGTGPLSSRAMVEEWGYPNIGIVLCDMPSAGHDAVMLDYRGSGAEPAVAYIDEDREPRVVAATFSEFITRLEQRD